MSKITLWSSDHKSFVVDESVAVESVTIKHMIEDDCTANGIPLPNVTSKILAKVVECCKKHSENKKANKVAEDGSVEEEEHDLKAWDEEFVKIDVEPLFELIQAANFLNIEGLLALLCQTVADMMKGKTPEEIRETFHIKNDFTQEEEEAVRKENSWAFK